MAKVALATNDAPGNLDSFYTDGLVLRRANSQAWVLLTIDRGAGNCFGELPYSKLVRTNHQHPTRQTELCWPATQHDSWRKLITMSRTRTPKARRDMPLSQLKLRESALKRENAKLQKRIFKLEAELVSAGNRIAAFEQDRKKRDRHAGPSSINLGLDESKAS